MAVIIGSTAIKHHFLDFPREPKDLDKIVHYGSGDRADGDIFSHPLLDRWLGGWDRVATVNELYTLKASHCYWELDNGSWSKHIFDLQWLKKHDAKMEWDLHDIFYDVWKEIHGTKKTNLKMGKDDFFQDAVVRTYDHDSIHRSVAYDDTALYEQILKDGSTVEVDSKKMWGLSFDNLIRLFREEIYATALERILIPTNYRASPGAAYLWSLRRTITSLTKGRSAAFIVDNYDLFANPYGDNENYLSRHLAKRDKLVKL